MKPREKRSASTRIRTLRITPWGGSIGYAATIKAALASFKETIKIDPNFAAAYAQAANEMVFLGDAKGAIPMAEKAIELSPKDKSIQCLPVGPRTRLFRDRRLREGGRSSRAIGPCAAEPLVYPGVARGGPCLVQSG